MDISMPAITDTHAHLADESFAEDRQAVLERAKAVGISSIWVAGEGPGDNEQVLRVCAQYPLELKPCLGLFPDRADHEQAQLVADQLRENRYQVAAISEVGLDYRLEEVEDRRAIQAEVLAFFAGVGLELDLPLSVHSRAAGQRALEVLCAVGAKKVIMHAFDARANRALAGVEAGFFFSIPPSLLRSRQKEKLVSVLPLESILLESDAPVLGPEPRIRNEPARIIDTLERIAQLKGVTPAEVATVVADNFARLGACC